MASDGTRTNANRDRNTRATGRIAPPIVVSHYTPLPRLRDTDARDQCVRRKRAGRAERAENAESYRKARKGAKLAGARFRVLWLSATAMRRRCPVQRKGRPPWRTGPS